MRRAGRVASVLAAGAIAACFTKPGAPHTTGDAGDPDGRGTNTIVDASPDAKPPGACLEDDFDDMAIMNCETWGTSSGAATYTRAGMVLGVIFTGMNQSGTCTTKMPFDITNGTSIELEQMPQAGPVNLTLQTAGTTTKFEIQRPFGMYGVHLFCNGNDLGTGENPTSAPPRWLQLRLTNLTVAQFSVLSETSDDGVNWTPGSSCTYQIPPSTTGTVSFTANSGSGSGSAMFDDFNTKNCP